MGNSKILIPGEEKPVPEHQSVKDYFPGAEIQSYTISAVRGAEASAVKVEVENQDVVVTEFENNIQWFNNGSDFIEKIQTQQPPLRGAQPDGVLMVPMQWQENNAPARGVVSTGLKLLGLHVFKNVAGKAIAKDIAKRIEQNNQNILYFCDESFNLGRKFSAADVKSPSSKYLLLLHGTGSDTKSGFGGLVNQPAKSVYSNLYKAYEGRIIAFEHKTFSQSPVQNITELVSQLPDDMTFDILSHSRGGLLGEILARISSQGWTGVFTQEEMNMLKKNEDAATLVSEIETLNKAVAKKHLKVNMFIRVACPAAGTTLVSDRADKLLNVLFNILSNIPGEIASTVIEGLKALVTAVVNEKNNTATLPGIECMKPDSNFIKALNYYNTKIESDLVVIAGDARGEGFINKIKMFLVDAFYKEDNDLVVNTISMKKGTPRTKPFLIYDEQAANVNHFHYFINTSSQGRIITAFTGNADATKGFYESTKLVSAVPPDVANAPQSRAGKTIKDQPVLYVLPGIMGSNLEVDNSDIWLNYFRIAMGDLKFLKLTPGDSVKATSINGSAYKKLVDYFSNYYYVIPFAYDWRRSVFEAAKALSESVKQTLSQTEETKQIISFVVHSMGGLVFRAFVTEYPELWKQLQERPGCRVLMLGTPNAGSYVVPRLLMGNDRSVSALAALDLTSSKKKLLEQFVQYEGLLELLPAKNEHDDFGDLNKWKEIQQASGFDYAIPGKNTLSGYEKMQKDAFRNFQYDSFIVKYIAGKGDQTPNRIEIDKENNKLNFYATPHGDGTVTWETIPEELLKTATYYVNAEHGSLAKHEASFKGYQDLLDKGITTRLSTAQPVTRSDVKTELMPEQEQVTVPDEAMLSNHVMGIGAEETTMPDQQVTISITHGDLGHAVYPLIAGHFKGDGILQAEKVLDKKLDNYLSIRNATNNYPGPIGTHEIIPANAKSKGAIIVGLGDFGTLTENLLSQTLKQALLSYIIQNKKTADSTSGVKTLGISYLLIGSGFGGLTIYSCIKALLAAVKEANSLFGSAKYADYSLITTIEIIELYKYKAVQVGRILYDLTTSNSLFSNVLFFPETIKTASGAISEIPNETQTDWWHRLKISQQEEIKCNDKIISRAIVFTSITDKARNEEKVLNTNISIVDKMIKEGAASTNHNVKLCQTLYELLVPNEFKGYGSDLRNIVLLVDNETARYPWEMMMDAYSGRKEPLVTKTGFLRQLGTSTYRENVELSVENNALVVGNPELHNYYPPLPGAAVEAQGVASLLEDFGYKVNKDYIDVEAQGVLLELYSTQYKIVHIAAHGVLKDKVTCQTGIVLGEQLILTPSDFKQMRKVPELVFINCCSLGTINKDDEERLQRKYEVAAGIGTQLINMGVKAVIVAGWEVSDDAAAGFSYTFYNEMLKGRNFGDAVQTARETIYTQYPESNTWGAYQCYGDPQYYLRIIDNDSNKADIKFCDPVEAIDKLQTLTSQAEAASTRDDKEAMQKEIDRIIKAIEARPEWKFNASITELMAELCKQMGKIPEAIAYYELLFNMENAEYNLKTIEQYCNVKVKQAAKECKAVLNKKDTTDDEKKDAVEKAEKTIEGIIQILKNISIKPTSERLNLIASAYRRLAEINSENNKKFRVNLILSANYYFEGYETYLNVYNQTYYYPLHNWLIISAIVSMLATKEEQNKYAAVFAIPVGEDLDKVLDNAVAYAAESDKTQPSFWNKTSASAKFLLKLMLAKTSEDIDEFKNKIIQDHISAWDKEGSADKQNAISEHAKFIKTMFEKYGDKLTGLQLIDVKLKALQTLAQDPNQWNI